MTTDRIAATDKVEAACSYNTQPEDTMSIHGSYHAVCYDAQGNVKWEDDMGLKGVGTANVADTQASHASWLEVGLANAPTYSGNRKTPTFGAAAAGVKATSSASSFSITSTGTVAGCFINIGGSATIDNTTGTLFSAGDFSSSKAVVSGDSIAVTYSATLT
jgi:hypothetical protein